MFFKVTLTSRNGLSKESVDSILIHFNKCKKAYIVHEFGEAGTNSHLEGVIEMETSKTSNVTRGIERVYENLKLEIVKGISIHVVRVTNLPGAFIYASKELEKEGRMALMKGWDRTFVDEICKENVRNIPYSMLKRAGTRLYPSTAAALMYEWCKENERFIVEKNAYLEVVHLMADDGYMFDACRHLGLYPALCSLFGDGSASRNVAESDLRFID